MQPIKQAFTHSTKAFLVLLVCASLFLSGCTGSKPTNIGVNNGKLAPCPESPNCVNSTANDSVHAIKPIRFKQPVSQMVAIQAVKDALLSLPNIEIIEETNTYIYAESTSKIMRYVDDVEFMFPNEALITEVHLRSASRLGYKDFNVNRERIEKIRAHLIEAGSVVR